MEEKAPPKPTPAQHAWGAYRKIRKRVQETKQQQREEAIARGEDQVEVRRRQQGALEREVRARHAAGKLAKAPVEPQQPVQEEGEEMKEDDEESEYSGAGGTKST